MTDHDEGQTDAQVSKDDLRKRVAQWLTAEADSPLRRAYAWALITDLAVALKSSGAESTLLRAQLAQQAQQITALVGEAVPLLRCVRVLDCGAHYCRYCPAKSPEWDHDENCPYVVSQRDNTAASELAERLAALQIDPRQP